MKKQRRMTVIIENLLDEHPGWSALQLAAEASRVIAEPRKKPVRPSRLKRKYG